MLSPTNSSYHPQRSNNDSLHPIPLLQCNEVGSSVGSSTWLVQDQLHHLDWGTQHPDYLKVRPKRVCWTEEELDYIRTWCVNNNTVSVERLASRCLAFIHGDPLAVPIFHQHHILNSARLRNGYDAYVKRTKDSCLFDLNYYRQE